ncbi:MAG: hypothetical protein ACI4P0_04830 [Mailhella sp.]
MRKIEKLLVNARETERRYERQAIDKVFRRMTTEQLRQLAFDDLTENQVREILASVDGLFLLESG